MQKRQKVLLAGVSLLATGVLAACSGGSQAGKSETSTYSYVYTTDPDSLNYLTVNKTSTSEVTGNIIDGLLENDQYGNLVPSLAEDWKVSKDGLTYTYKLRKGAKWFTSDGEEYAEVTAKDFVAGLKHAVDSKSEALYIVQDSIKGLDAYVKGETSDFSTVGVKAVDDYTVQYTLNSPESFWNSKTTMSILFPVNEEFLASQGDKFGTPTDPTTLLYNGPYLISAYTPKSSLEFVKNKNYWGAKDVHIDQVKLTFYDGSDSDSLYKGFDEGVYSIARIFPNSSLYSTVKEKYGDNIVYSPQAQTTYYGAFNLDRQNYDNTSKKTDDEKAATKAAILNKDFRQAISFAFDRNSYAAQVVGKDGAHRVLRTSIVPSAFVSVDGKNFSDLVEKELEGYGSEWKDVSLADGQDSFYNPEKAKAEFAKAKEALAASGVKFPIHLDYPVLQTSDTNVAQSQSFKNSVESTLGTDNVVIDLQMLDEDAFHASAYFAQNASQINYDISFASGWGPDYQDPSTYLDIFNTSVKGSHSYILGIDGGADSAAATTTDFGQYNSLLADASKEKTDISSRYNKYAKAEAWLTDESVLLPYYSNGGAPSIRKLVPFTFAYGQVGIKGDKTFKYLQLSDKPVLASDYEKASKEWQEKVAESNKKAQEDLANHIE